MTHDELIRKVGDDVAALCEDSSITLADRLRIGRWVVEKLRLATLATMDTSDTSAEIVSRVLGGGA